MNQARRLLLSSVFAIGCGGSQMIGGAPNGDVTSDGSVVGDGPGDSDAAIVPVVVVDVDGGTLSPAQLAAANEQNTAATLQSIASNPTAVATFMKSMPKGGDLHHHLSGAVYAEQYLAWAKAAGNFCLNSNLSLLSSGCNASDQSIPSMGDALYTQTIEAWSMLNYVPTTTIAGANHFFATFSDFGAITGTAYHAKGLADVMTRADGENESYIELMLFSNSTAENVGSSVWSSGHGTSAMTMSDFAGFRTALMASGSWPPAVQAIVTDVTNTESGAHTILSCASTPMPSPCRVATRYEVYISRSGPAQEVFAEMVAAFEAAKLDARVVALNLVGPEYSSGALAANNLEMQMLDYLYGVYNGQSPLRVTLHAGEMTASALPSSYSLSTINHIENAIVLGHAQRIGHGVDIMSESNPTTTLAMMHDQQVLAEICLTSNAQILGVTGSAHPLAKYLAAGVPVALATDDQGVERTSIAAEYARAVTDQNLGYMQLKELARNSLEYSFLPGPSLWSTLSPATAASACAPSGTALVGGTPSSACAAYLTQSARATAQWELEKRFLAFEALP